MILYYAMGGGMGHLARAEAFLHTFQIPSFKILTASSYGDRIFNPADLIRVDPSLERDPGAFRVFLKDALSKHSIERVVMDCFPNGILGEIRSLEDLNELPVWYVTRRVRWEQYSDKLNDALHFERAFILEELEKGQWEYVSRTALELWEGQLTYPERPVPEAIRSRMEERDGWLVVHAGPAEEVEMLVGYACDVARAEKMEPALVLVSPYEMNGVWSLDFYPAHALFPYAGRIFSGAGFNVMQQAARWSGKHVFIPFERRYDDQFRRAGIRRNSAADYTN